MPTEERSSMTNVEPKPRCPACLRALRIRDAYEFDNVRICNICHGNRSDQALATATHAVHQLNAIVTEDDDYDCLTWTPSQASPLLPENVIARL